MMHTHRFNLRRLFTHAFLLFLSSISIASHAVAADILTTLPPLSGLVHWLDPKASVQCLLPNSADPHHFQLTPKQVESLQQAKLLIRSSKDDGQWPRLQTSGETLDLWPSHADPHHVATEHHHEHGNHAWLNPEAVEPILPTLAQALIHANPEHKTDIEQQLKQAQQQLITIQQQWEELSEALELQERGAIMQHAAWVSLFEDLKIPVWITLESDQHAQEHGPQVLEDGLKILQAHPDSLLIADRRHNNRSLEWLKRQQPDSIIITLDALGSAELTWPALMLRNMELLQQL